MVVVANLSFFSFVRRPEQSIEDLPNTLCSVLPGAVDESWHCSCCLGRNMAVAIAKFLCYTESRGDYDGVSQRTRPDFCHG